MSLSIISSGSIVESIGSSATPTRVHSTALVIDSESKLFEDHALSIDFAILTHNSFLKRTPWETILSILLQGQDTPTEATTKTTIPRVGLIPDNSPWAGFDLRHSTRESARVPLAPLRSVRVQQQQHVDDYLEGMPLERVKAIEDDIKTLQARLTSAEEEVMTLRGRVIELLDSRDAD
nr:hypothetical protein [Tanacetum cinerariifolium]